MEEDTCGLYWLDPAFLPICPHPTPPLTTPPPTRSHTLRLPMPMQFTHTPLTHLPHTHTHPTPHPYPTHTPPHFVGHTTYHTTQFVLFRTFGHTWLLLVRTLLLYWRTGALTTPHRTCPPRHTTPHYYPRPFHHACHPAPPRTHTATTHHHTLPHEHTTHTHIPYCHTTAAHHLYACHPPHAVCRTYMLNGSVPLQGRWTVPLPTGGTRLFGYHTPPLHWDVANTPVCVGLLPLPACTQFALQRRTGWATDHLRTRPSHHYPTRHFGRLYRFAARAHPHPHTAIYGFCDSCAVGRLRLMPVLCRTRPTPPPHPATGFLLRLGRIPAVRYQQVQHAMPT